MRRLRLDPAAEAELREAAAWYRERSPEAARRFLRDPAIEPPVRRALLDGFPCALVFIVGPEAVHVLAVAHTHRSPGYWIDRIRAG